MTRPLAVLRPEPGNTATARRIEALGLTAIRLPLFAIRAVAWTPPDPAHYDALLLTSANAVRHAGTGLEAVHGLPVVAVGEATARAARAAGLTVETVGEGDAAAAIRASAGKRLLHLAGHDRVDTGVDAITVYTAETVPVASVAMLAGSVALLHSARAARRLAELLQRDAVRDLRIAALSEAVRAAGPDCPGAVAGRPDDATLVALAARLAD
ncbi:uroporphyrinogen-III synthase [Sphingomonas sp.]|uniref:uroporphyrinogen-III synthase n=1 Tax=Sphingomonas sp. TaxID=28214 RepID=UPI0035BC47FA